MDYVPEMTGPNIALMYVFGALWCMFWNCWTLSSVPKYQLAYMPVKARLADDCSLPEQLFPVLWAITKGVFWFPYYCVCKPVVDIFDA